MITVPGTAQYVGGVSYFVADQNLLSQVVSRVEADNWISPTF